jgi:hypothetical protein
MRRVPRRALPMCVFSFAATLALLSLCACSGGFQGGTPSAPSVSQPASVTVTVGQTATFSVTASGTGPLTYQWFQNGTAIPGATGSTYAIPDAGMSQSGTTYTVVVSNGQGSAKGGPATLTVQSSAPIAKSLLPSNATPAYGATVLLVPTFSGGTATIGSTGVGSSDITANAVSGSSYPTPALTSGKTYTLTVKDSKGNIVSTTCLVTPSAVALTPITPANQTEAPGNVSFTTTATGGITNTVTWSATGGTFAENIWTSPIIVGTYTIKATSVDNPSVFVTTTTTITGPVINTQPVSQHDCSNGAITLSVAASYATSYQWNFNGAPIPGATSSTYSVANASSANAGSYSVTVSNGTTPSVTSNVAVVAVGSSITSNPVNLSLHPTQVGTFSVVAQGLSPFTYQWYQIPSGGSTGTAISGATSPVYTTPAVDISYNGAKYYAAVTDSCAGIPLNSTQAALTVTAANVSPTIITQPAGQTVPVGGTTSYTVVATGSGTLAYQWYVIPAGGAVGTKITGATSATYNVPATSTTIANDQDKYYVVVSNAYGQAISQQATLAVGAGILITQQPQTVYVDVGGTATYTVAATSTLPLTYQWYEAPAGTSAFAPIAGATNTTYMLSPAALTDNGDVFRVVVSNGTPVTATSDTAAIFVGPLAQVPDLCDTHWSAIDNAITEPSCSYQLTASTGNQHGEIVWPTLISTDNIQLSFTVTLSNPSATPADGFTIVLGDPSLGATPTSIGSTGMGLGAEGIPGLVFAFDTYHNPGDPTVPYVGVGRGEAALFEDPWFFVNTNIPQLVSSSIPITHSYTVTLVQGALTVTLDGSVVISGNVTPPPIAYLYVTASTGGSWETTLISNVSAVVSQPPN